jgi:hypothetical protein
MKILKNDFYSFRGRTVREMLEHAVSQYDAQDPDPRGWFLQISGWDWFLNFGPLLEKLNRGTVVA